VIAAGAEVRGAFARGEFTMTSSSSADRARRRAVRQRMAETGDSYTTAARILEAAGPAVAVLDTMLLVPYPDETDVDFTELGWRVLPADASPQEKARAEVSWRPVTASRHCRCSGPCYHNHSCSDLSPGFGCTGRFVHLGRRPELGTEPVVWSDSYRCNECGTVTGDSVTLDTLPWGQATPDGLVVFDGVQVPGLYDDGDDDTPQPYCGDCGAWYGYQCTCENDDGYCPECGAGNAPYGCGCD
jgi:hypothetical protein